MNAPAWMPWAGGVVLALLGAALGGCKTVTVETVIRAKPATVWSVLSDAPGFARWNPVHVKVEGEFREGEVVRIHVKDGTGKVSAFPSTVRRLAPERALAQGGGVPGFLTFDHSFHLEAVDGGTRVVQREQFRGAGVLFADLDWVEDGYRRVNAALKQTAEAREIEAR